MKITICDLCGAKCEPVYSIAKYRVQVIEETPFHGDEIKTSQNIDLCKECSDKFDKIVKNHLYQTTVDSK